MQVLKFTVAINFNLNSPPVGACYGFNQCITSSGNKFKVIAEDDNSMITGVTDLTRIKDDTSSQLSLADLGKFQNIDEILTLYTQKCPNKHV